MRSQKYFWAANLKFLRKRRKFSQDELAEKLGMTRVKLNSLENGHTKSPSIDDLLLCADFFRMSVDTLLRIELSRLSELKIRDLEAGNDIYMAGSKMRVLATTVNLTNEDNIEMVPVKAKAGYMEGYGDPEFISTLPVFNLPTFPKDKKYRMFQTEGDSMLPIPDGAYVIGSFLMDWKLAKETACVVVTENEGISFKMVSFSEEKKSFSLRSLNPLYSTYEVNAEEVREIWKFEATLSKELPTETLTLQQIGLGIAEINRKLEDLTN
ncbi:LexA family transcriptional regulator [Algoriphagus sp. AGSA1]|uniref:XRE family transcriptional regulator n=1 Tax=unclassified Algoriphagus TaxID=2641541 RepID=UPI00177AF0E5|nr:MULTISPECIES: LexA family transcriptional regulator [unclassified Algoriphagus]MCE7056286.1 LexA family transcriptional regulator [Algoriphagus sp. AGSA1]